MGSDNTARVNQISEKSRRMSGHGARGRYALSHLFRSSGPGYLPNRKAVRITRPRAQVVTAIAGGIVLFAILILIRSAAMLPPHPDMPPDMTRRGWHTRQWAAGNTANSKWNRKRKRGEDHHGLQVEADYQLRRNEQKLVSMNPRLTPLIAADGSHFLVDLRGNTAPIDIRYTGVQSRLAVHAINRRVSRKGVPIAFFLQISQGNLVLLPRLLITLWHRDHIYLIHFDAKIPTEHLTQFEKVVASISIFDNVFILPSDAITYKGVSMLLNTLSAMEFLLSLPSRHRWTYFINLSGSDYPLVNSDTISHLLAQPQIVDRNLSFVQIATDKKFWQSMKESRFNFIYYDDALALHNSSVSTNTSLLHTWKEHPLKHNTGVQFLQAEAWIIAHRSFVQFSVRSNFARKLLLLLSMMQDPEEHFFAMLAWNNPRFNSSLAHHAFRAVYWELHGKMSGQHPYYIDQVNESGIYPFWQNHIHTSPCFFARKVRQPQSRLLNRIDRHMSGTHLSPNMTSVTASHTTVRKFVQCISNVRHPTQEIRSYNMCY